MFKRFIFLLVLLTIAFFVYRKINPEWAQTLISKVNHILGRDEVATLTGDVLTWDILSGELLTGVTITGSLPTWAIETWWLMENIETQTWATLTPCAAEWEFANEALGRPANCCTWLQGFFTGQGMRIQVDPGELCYDPAKGIPRCTTIADKEWRYSSWTLLVLDDCNTVPIADTVVLPSQITPKTTTGTVKTTTKPKTSSDVRNTQNLINNLFK